jgi:hypothetical protein
MDDLPGNVRNGGVTLGERPLPSCAADTSLVCLNFKVPLRIRQQFKIFAARHNMTMTELLLRLLDDRLSEDANLGQTTALTKQAINK